MYMKRRISPERLERVCERALSNPVIELPNRSPVHDRCLPAGASAACGTWADRPSGRRCGRRVTVTGEIAMRRMGSFSFQVPIGDLSTRGCRIELVEFLDVDDHVIARLPGLEAFSARVTWSDARCAGVEFEHALHPAVFEQLLARLA
jgi:hypothetical protein